MKRSIVLGLSVIICAPILAGHEKDAVNRSHLIAVTTALMELAEQLITTMPSLAQEIAQFPSLAETGATALENAMNAATSSAGDIQQQQLHQLFVDGVDLTVLVTNTINTVLSIVSLITPVIEALEPANSAKIDKAMQLLAHIMQMISTINVAMKNAIVAGGTVTVSATVAATPTLNPVLAL